jgi:RNA polymerase sigma-70 factor (ECF subfamily)
VLGEEQIAFMTKLVDKLLVFQLRSRKDPEAFAKLYDRYVTPIYRFVLLKLPSKEDAEDLTSETFLKCFRYIQEGNDVKEIRSLLYKIARNGIADWYRARAASPSRSLAVTFMTDETSTPYEGTHDVSDAGRGKATIEARAELAVTMGKLERLKDDYRDILTLRLVDDLPFAIIADVMGKEVGTVRVLYHRAKKALDAIDQEGTS